MQQISRVLLFTFLLLNLAACSTISDWFDSDEDDPTAPVPLVDIDATVEFDELWSVDVGNGQGQGLYRLQPAMNGDALYAASADGEVVAVDRSNGKTRWEVDLETSLSGGVGILRTRCCWVAVRVLSLSWMQAPVRSYGLRPWAGRFCLLPRVMENWS